MQGRVGPRWLFVVCLSLALAGGLVAVTAVAPGTAADEPPGSGSAVAPIGEAATAQTLASTDAAAPSGSTAVPSGSVAAPSPSAVAPSEPATASSGSAATSPTVADGSSAAASAVQSDDAIVERVEYDRLPAEPERVEARIVYEVPDNVESLSFRITDGEYDVVGLDGFERTDGDFEWDGTGDGGSVTISHDVDESFRQEAADQQFVGGTDDWAIVARPQTATNISYFSPRPTFDYQLAAPGEGYAGERFAFLGPHETRSDTVDGERLTLVVPDAAEPASEPAAILDSMTYASDRLRVGNRNDEVVTIVAPTGEIDWGPPGLAVGSDTRVSADARVGDPVNVWVHEYVHTRQYRDAGVPRGDAVADDAHWLIEGSADYFAALTSLEQDRIDFETFRSVLERGTDPAYDDVVLAERSTWRDTDAEYEKGALVVGAIDRELRAASDGAGTFQAVMRDWNDAETFSAGDLEAAAAEHGDESVREFVETHTRTTEPPSTWDRSTHGTLFDSEIARFDYRVVSDPPLSVGGPYREGALGDPLVVGETVSTSVRVENVGNAAGSYRATLAVGEADRAVATGELDPGEQETVDLSQRLTRTGDLRIVTGDVSRTIGVREPASPSVSQLQIEPRSPVAGDEVAVTVTVANPTDRPADGNVTVRANGEPIGSERVRLGPGENDTIELSTSFSEPGEHELGAGELSLRLSVQEPGLADRLPLTAIVALGVLGVVALAGGGLALYRRQR